MINEQPKQENPADEPRIGAESKTDQEASAQRYTYRWSYEAQAAYDRKELKEKRGKGAKVYAIVMSVAFLLCLAVLGGTVMLSALETPDRSLSASQVAELVNPGTVLIYASSEDSSGYGTGFFVRSNGYIVTNYHIVNGMSSVTVTLYSGEELDAKVQWYSLYDDLAILKVEGENFPVLTLGDSSQLKMGDTAIAIGNPAGNLCPWTLTQGVISSVNREVTVDDFDTHIVDLTLLQTDAQVNPGNSGGPLCNDRGEVIGIVSRKMTDYEGLGLAIPINGAMELVNAYLETGTTEHIVSKVSRARPQMGVSVVNVKVGDRITNDYKAPCDGILVVAISENSGASKVLMIGDIIISLDGKTVTNQEALKKILYQYRVGDTVNVGICRNGENLTVKLKFS